MTTARNYRHDLDKLHKLSYGKWKIELKTKKCAEDKVEQKKRKYETKNKKNGKLQAEETDTRQSHQKIIYDY